MDNATITTVARSSPAVRQYEVTPDERTFDGEPGQQTMIQKAAGDTAEASSQYSVLRVDRDNDNLRDLHSRRRNGAIKHGRPRWWRDEPGRPVAARGFHAPTRVAPAAFTSTGRGITEMIAILYDSIDSAGPQATFLLGAKTRGQLLCDAMFTQGSGPSAVGFEFVCSRASWHGREGHVRTYLDKVFETFEERDYTCGVPPMGVGASDPLHHKYGPEDRIPTDGWERSRVS